MFTFNDGRAHERVEVLGDLTHWEPVELARVGESPQYAVAPATVLALAHAANGASQYKFRIDGEWVLVPGLPTAHDADGNLNQLYDADQMGVARDVWDAAGSTYLHHAPAAPSGLLVYVIPGNPGLCEYYESFLAALARLLPGAELVAPSYRGFRLDEPAGAEPALLDAQIAHITAFLAWFREHRAPHATRVAVLGHSVGSWIAQRLATRAPDIVFVGMLMPTVRSIALSERGQTFTAITRFVGANAAAWYVWSLSWLPFSRWVLRRFLNRAMPPDTVPASARDTSLRLIQSPAVVKQVIALAIEEMRRIGPDAEPEDIRGFWDGTPHVWALFASHDHWVSAATRDELLELAATKPNVETQTVDGLRHAFCIRESSEVAGLAARAIAAAIDV